MLDELAVQRTLNTYTQGCSQADWDTVMSTFLPDGVWEVRGVGEFQGYAAIQAVMSAFVGQMAYFVQINSPALIAINGDKATARSIIRECGKYADRDEALEVLGFYTDALVRTLGGWKFARRTFKSAGMHACPLLPAA